MTLAVIIALALLATPATALALSGASSSGDASAAQYAQRAVTSSQLPFTGYLLIAAVPVALVLLSSGLALRRATRPRY